MNRWARFVGIAGLLLLFFGLIGWMIGLIESGGGLALLARAHIWLGAVLIIVWFFTHGAKNVASTAGVVGGRAARFWINALLYALVFLGLLVAVNWLGVQHKKRWDLTSEGVYSLAPQSKSVIGNLKKPLKLVAFKGTEVANDEYAKELLSLYRDENTGRVQTEIIDPRTKPHLIEQFEIKPGNVLYIEYGEGEKKGVSRINELSEEAITNAVLKLTRGEAKKVYVVEGHGEPSLTDASPNGLKSMADALSDEHFNVEPIFLGQTAAVPDDAAALLLIAPHKEMLQSEKDVLSKYIDAGGKVLMMTDPRGSPDISALAAKYNIKVDQDVVVDLIQRLFDAPAIGAQIVARDYGAHAVTKNMSGDNKVIFNIASSVRSAKSGAEAAQDGSTTTELIKSSPSSWGETNLKALFEDNPPQANKDADDIAGPVSLAVAWEKKLPDTSEKAEKEDGEKFEKVSRVVVVGNSDWVKNGIFNYFSNRDLLLNMVSWLSGEEGGITLRPRSIKGSAALITKSDFEKIFASSLLIPELILLFGLVVWWRRRTAESR